MNHAAVDASRWVTHQALKSLSLVTNELLSKKVCASPFLHKVIYPKNFAQVLLPKASCIHGRAGGDVEVPARITSVMIKFVRA